MLNGLKGVKLTLWGAQTDSAQRQSGRAAVEQLLTIRQHMAAVALAKALARQALDALIVAPGIGGKAIVHETCTGACEKAAGQQPQFDLRHFAQSRHRCGGTVAPAAQRVEYVMQGLGHRGLHCFNTVIVGTKH